jgi:hypothetical protein
MDGQSTLKDLQRLAPLCVVGCPSQDNVWPHCASWAARPKTTFGPTVRRGLPVPRRQCNGANLHERAVDTGTGYHLVDWGSSGCGRLLWLFGSLPCVVFVCASLVCRQNPLQVALIRLAGQTTVWSMGAL